MRLFAGILTRAHPLVYEIEARMTSGLTETEHQQMVALVGMMLQKFGETGTARIEETLKKPGLSGMSTQTWLLFWRYSAFRPVFAQAPTARHRAVRLRAG